MERGFDIRVSSSDWRVLRRHTLLIHKPHIVVGHGRAFAPRGTNKRERMKRNFIAAVECAAKQLVIDRIMGYHDSLYDKVSIRKLAMRQLSGWWSKKIDELMMEQLIGKS